MNTTIDQAGLAGGDDAMAAHNSLGGPPSAGASHLVNLPGQHCGPCSLFGADMYVNSYGFKQVGGELVSPAWGMTVTP